MLVVAGKGGVGRSTVAAALARQGADAGARVLAVDAMSAAGLRLALGHPAPLPTGVSLLELSTEASLDQYVRMNLRLPIAPSNLGPIARIFDYVATAAPAVREILTIGKIGHEVRRGGWDLVVVDGPATGHVVELLSAPDALGALIGIGPLASETGWLSDLLADPATTSAVVVTTTEELPVTETLELINRLATETKVRLGGVVVNRLPPAVGPAGLTEAAALACGHHKLAGLAEIAVDRHRQATAGLDRLAGLRAPLVEIGEDQPDPAGKVLDALTAAGWPDPLWPPAGEHP